MCSDKTLYVYCLCSILDLCLLLLDIYPVWNSSTTQATLHCMSAIYVNRNLHTTPLTCTLNEPTTHRSNVLCREFIPDLCTTKWMCVCQKMDERDTRFKLAKESDHVLTRAGRWGPKVILIHLSWLSTYNIVQFHIILKNIKMYFLYHFHIQLETQSKERQFEHTPA